MLNVRDLGAAGDGHAYDGRFIQRAIDQCASAGGGTVLVPPGRYRSGTLQLRANVHVHLEAGATIRACSDPDLFPVLATTLNRPGQIRALLFAEGADAVTISGPGCFEGDGDAPLAGSAAAAATDAASFRPAMAYLRDCRNLTMRDVAFRHASFWTLHLLRCTDVQLRGLSIANHPGRINTDGIDPDGCRNVTISDCRIACGDDCIVLKSTQGDACEHIVVSNCVLSTPCAALKIGTESLGRIGNVTFGNCVIHDSRIAAAVYMKDGGHYANIAFHDLVVDASGDFPFIVDVTPRSPAVEHPGRVRNVCFDSILVRGPGRFCAEGAAAAPIENLAIRNFTWDLTGTCDFARSRKPAGAARVQPDARAANPAIHPYQFILRQIRGLHLADIHVTHSEATAAPDRSLAYLHEVDAVTLRDATLSPRRADLPLVWQSP